MRRDTGFTLVELMVVIVMLGILGASAIPTYQTYLQRSYGSEAYLTMKNLLEGEILYYLENDSFFPPEDQPIMIPREGPFTVQTDDNIKGIADNLNINIKVGHNLEYLITNYVDRLYIIISADFPLFKDGHTELHGRLTHRGEMYIFPAG